MEEATQRPCPRAGRDAEGPHMRTRTHSPSVPGRGLWSGRLWPVVAGAVTAVGIFAASGALGVVALVLVYVSLSMFAVTVVWGLSLELGIERASVLRLGLSSALAVLVVLGLGQLHPAYGLGVAMGVGLSSPASLAVLAKIRRRSSERHPDESAGAATGVLYDKQMINRRFEEIVGRLTEPGDDGAR